ncbi:ABC transporter substrate-binding protein [Muricoccus aerilatus]|uniref:ABC transporter substrate-binding protein n=1 Tax=Muricoccus aerilatus TaxID=452982 RepID=UPI0005C19E9F|nr:ABC transporter substrate-binding protein [Roseomonas aerilata]
MAPLPRRALLAALLPGRGAQAATGLWIAVLDLTIAETLIAMGRPPAAMLPRPQFSAGLDSSLPDGATALASGAQPNLELLASLRPDIILITPLMNRARPRLARIAPVTVIPAPYRPGLDSWGQMVAFTRSVGTAIGDTGAAERLVADTDRHFAVLRGSVPAGMPPLLVIRQWDDRHARVYGRNGLVQAALDRLGLRNAWTGPTNAFGFAQVGIESIFGLEGRLVVIDPPFIEKPVAASEYRMSGLWRYMPRRWSEEVVRIPYVFHHFGALNDSRRFADALVPRLEVAR